MTNLYLVHIVHDEHFIATITCINGNGTQHHVRTIIDDVILQDVTYEIDEKPDTYMGSDIEVTLTLKNTCKDATRTVNGSLSLSSMYYTGVLHKHVTKTELKDVVLAPGSGK